MHSRLRGALFGIVLASAACNTPSRDEGPPPSSKAQAASPRATAMAPLMPQCAPQGEPMVRTGHIELEKPDPEPRGKTFLGAWLVDDQGTRWVLTYSPDSPLRPLAGQQVQVVGRRCSPKYQALIADHFLIETIEPLR